MSKFAYLLTAIAIFSAAPAQAGGLNYVGECVPFARAASGIQIFGDAWTWWSQAEGRYARGHAPRVGAVIVFARSSRLRLGHVAVVSRIVTPRVAMVTHANWSRRDGKRGHTEQDVTLTDVSRDNDWSAVKIWYRDQAGLGTTVYSTYGFVYGTPDKRAPAAVPKARPAAYLSSRQPDYVGALIDVYAR
jgi:hypothetical protein